MHKITADADFTLGIYRSVVIKEGMFLAVTLTYLLLLVTAGRSARIVFCKQSRAEH